MKIFVGLVRVVALMASMVAIIVLLSAPFPSGSVDGTITTRSDSIVSALSDFLGSRLFPESDGHYTNVPVHETSDYRVLDTGQLRIDTSARVWVYLVSPLLLLAALTVFFHAALWGVMVKREWRAYFRAIDYVWYTAAIGALTFAAANLISSKALIASYSTRVQYEESKSIAAELTGRIRNICGNKEDFHNSRVETFVVNDGVTDYRISMCQFALDVKDFWSLDMALCEKGLDQAGRFDSINIWLTDAGTYLDQSRGINPVKCATDEPYDALWVCDNIVDIVRSVADAPDDSGVTNNAGPEVTYHQMVRAGNIDVTIPDGVRLCRLLDTTREIAGELSDAVKIRLALSKVLQARDLWMYFLAFAIALRLTKVTSDVRSA